MREKINREVAMVEEEYKAGRLKWTYEDVQRLIQPYPNRKGDDVLKAIGAHNFLDEEETPFEAEDIACGESETDSAVEESERDEAEVMDEAKSLTQWRQASLIPQWGNWAWLGTMTCQTPQRLQLQGLF